MFVIVMGAVMVVLLIACANLANPTLARTTARRNEIGTRLAPGASRTGIVLQVVVESLIVAVVSVFPARSFYSVEPPDALILASVCMV
jgi:ABC-type antimicrobial peptide transport system permease subunit